MRKSWILLLLFTFPITLMSQTILLRAEQDQVFRIPWNPRETGWNIYGNEIIKEIARIVLKEPARVGINFRYRLTVTLTQFKEENRLTIGLNHKDISGDCSYRAFPLNYVMQPSLASLRIRIASREDTSGYSEMILRRLPVFPKDTILTVCRLPAYNPEIDTLLVIQPEFFFDSMAVQLFMNRLNLINDYYASVAMLDSIAWFPEVLDYTDPLQLPFNYFRITEVNEVVHQIENRNFGRRLLKGGYDPSGLEKKIGTEKKRSLSLTYTLCDHLNLSSQQSWRGDIDSLSSFFVDRILTYVRRSQQMDHLFGKIYQDFLELYEVDVGRTGQRYNLRSLLARMYPEARLDTLPGFFLSHLNHAYIMVAGKLIDEKRFAEAFTLLAHGQRVAAVLEPEYIDQLYERLQVTAAEGILDSYAGIASTCIQSGKFQMAGIYLEKAGAYLLQNRRFIRSDSTYRSVFASLFFKRNSHCDRLLSSGQYRPALECYREFESIYEDREVAIIQEHLHEKKREAVRGIVTLQVNDLELSLKDKENERSLMIYDSIIALIGELPDDSMLQAVSGRYASVIGRMRYEQLFHAGSKALENGRFTLSISHLQKAKSLADRYVPGADPDFDSVYRIAMRNYLLVRLSGAQRHIWSDQFDSATIMMRVIREEAAQNQLADDDGLVRAFKRFGQKMVDQKCRNHRDTLDLCVMRADRCIVLKNFRRAVGYLEEALILAGQLPDCGIDVRAVRDTLEKYRWAGLYQQGLEETDSYVAAGLYSEAVRKLEEVDQLYSIYRIDRVGLSQEGVYEYIGKRSNPYLTLEATRFYAGRGAGRESLGFLHLLKIQNFVAADCADAQEACAKAVARNDFYRNSQSSPEVILTEYTSQDRWYTAFRGAYLGEWERMKKRQDQQ